VYSNNATTLVSFPHSTADEIDQLSCQITKIPRVPQKVFESYYIVGYTVLNIDNFTLINMDLLVSNCSPHAVQVYKICLIWLCELREEIILD
jgi:hypothetical protein